MWCHCGVGCGPHVTCRVARAWAWRWVLAVLSVPWCIMPQVCACCGDDGRSVCAHSVWLALSSLYTQAACVLHSNMRVHIRISVLHAASVPACVGLCAALCMAQWLLPNRAANRRARWWQGLHARNGVLLLCVCVLSVWHLLPNLPAQSRSCHRCMHVHFCVQVSLRPMVMCAAYLACSS